MDAECPLGSGALAGTTYPLDRFYTPNSSALPRRAATPSTVCPDRDFCIELCSAMATCMMHPSRLSEEIILVQLGVQVHRSWTTPLRRARPSCRRKKTPDVTELIRGKTGRVYGDLNTLLVMMKGLPLAYDKDACRRTRRPFLTP